jgi:hypothetical protein
MAGKNVQAMTAEEQIRAADEFAEMNPDATMPGGFDKDGNAVEISVGEFMDNARAAKTQALEQAKASHKSVLNLFKTLKKRLSQKR